MKQKFARLAAGVLAFAGNLSPLYLIWLLWPRVAPPKTPAEDMSTALMLDAFIALVFPLQHTLWTQRPVKRRMREWLGEYFERPAYSMASAVALVAMCYFWRTTDHVIWTAPTWWVWFARAGMIAALGMQFYAGTVIGPAFLMGTAHLKAFGKGEPVREPEFREAGPYRFLRHPIASSQVLMIWMFGVLHADRLLLTLMWTAWIIGATALEDRRLAADFGETYAGYRKRAGFLLPKIRRANS